MKAQVIPLNHHLNADPLRAFLKREGVDSGNYALD
jgi:hypothetical protein